MVDRALITGTSRGIGRATALELSRRGCELLLMGRASDKHEATVDACRAIGATVHSFDCELSDGAAIEQSARLILAEHGPPTIVINNAGVLEAEAAVHELPVDDWDRVMAVNLRAPFLLCRALLPAMLDAGRGRFIHVASVSATIGCPKRSAYGASKWGLLGFHKALHEELAGTGLQSIAVLPGSVDTDMLTLTAFEPDMTAEEVAALIAYYALEAPVAVAGANVEIYG
jgi:3-oxoacyl-[acyl-carrier protein] reductase